MKKFIMLTGAGDNEKVILNTDIIRSVSELSSIKLPDEKREKYRACNAVIVHGDNYFFAVDTVEDIYKLLTD